MGQYRSNTEPVQRQPYACLVCKFAHTKSVCGAREDAGVGRHRADTQSVQPGRQDSRMELFLAYTQFLRQWSKQRWRVNMGRSHSRTTCRVWMGCLGKYDRWTIVSSLTVKRLLGSPIGTNTVCCCVYAGSADACNLLVYTDTWRVRISDAGTDKQLPSDAWSYGRWRLRNE